jgi:hypothetical protein
MPMRTKSVSPRSLGLILILGCLWLLAWQLLSIAISPVGPVFAAEPGIASEASVSLTESSAGLLGPSATITTCVNNASYITTSTTFTSGNTYLANNCSIVVNAGVTLTIQPDVTVMFTGTASALIVNGTLLAESANPSQPITFTSQAATKSPGQWFGLHFASGSTGRLRNAFIGYAGSGVGGNVAQVRVVSADVQIRNSLVTDGKSAGIYMEGTGLAPVLDTVQVSSNTSGNPALPAYAIYQATVNMSPTFRSLVLTGNDSNAVTIRWGNEGIAQDITLGGSGAPYRFACIHTGCPQYIPDGKTLTIVPGTELQYDYSAFRMIVQSGGTLLAEGTAAQPITFTSGMTTPVAGNWQGIQVDANGSVRLAYCDIGYPGANSTPALDTAASDVQVRHTVFHDNASDGVRIHGTNVAPVFEDVSVLNSGGYGVRVGDDGGSSQVKPTWDGGVISGSGKTGIYMGYFNASAVQPTFRNVTITLNQGDGVSIARNGPVPTLENVSITGNTGAAVTQNPDSSPVYRNLTLSGNGADAVLIPGDTIGGGRYWGAGQPGLPFLVQGSVIIVGGAFLSLEPGMTLRFITDTLLNAIGGGALYALGTPDRPITFTGQVETPGSWLGITIEDLGQSILQNCDIGYAGGRWGQSLKIWSSSVNVVQNCRIHHSDGVGIYTNPRTPVLSYNQIYSHTLFGVFKGSDCSGGCLDARNNWWGDPTGPSNPTANPNGKGAKVNDYVIFSPWLTAPPTQTLGLGQVVVNTGGPGIVSPGQTVDYAVQYVNLMTRTVTSTVLMLQLPSNSQYLESPDGGLYWPERHQVLWRLNDLPAGGNGIRSARVRFNWGVDWGTKDGTVAILAGANYGQTELDVAPYRNYTPVSTTGETRLSDAQVATELAANPNMQILFSRAIAAGFAYQGWGGARYAVSSGAPVTQVVLLRSDRSAAVFLRRRGTVVLATTMARGYYAVNDTTGGITISQQTRESQSWGSWAPGGAVQGAPLATGCSCKTNCVIESAAGCIAGFGVLEEVFDGWQCLTDPLSTGCATGVLESVPGVGCLAAAPDCVFDCALDPNKYCCTEDKVGPPQDGWGMLNDFFGVNACQRTPCNTTTGNWGGLSYFTYCAGGQKCVAGKGCGSCPGGEAGASQTVCAAGGPSNSDCSDSDFLWARDPNAMYGPDGDLAPGQLVTYTITYENVGQGDAFGVFVTYRLSEYFDVATLTAHPTTTSKLIPNNNTLVWPVGQLGPKDTISSTGAVSFTVRLKNNLAGGTVIINQATVYFPSVPEETPTNPVVNVIQPVAAVPQQLQTDYVQPVGITLSGIEVSGLPLTFTVTEDPLNGILGGLAPTLVYTPAANFNGLDRFAFRAGNGISESRPAEVQIRVNPAGDATPPQVRWTEPVSGALAVAVQAVPVYTDTVGPVYGPFINVSFSEAISSTTVSTQTVQVVDSAGRVLSRTVGYDGQGRQVVVMPREPLRGGTIYTVTVTTGVQDMAGNPLSLDFKWSFLTSGAPPQKYVYLPLVMRNP